SGERSSVVVTRRIIWFLGDITWGHVRPRRRAPDLKMPEPHSKRARLLQMLGGRRNGPLLYPHHGSSAISQALWRMIILSAITRSPAVSGIGSRRISGAICGKKRIQTVTPLQMPMAWALLGILKPLRAMTM